VAVLPLPDTVAIEVSELLQENVPPDGEPVAVNLAVLPAPHIFNGLGLTVTLHAEHGAVVELVGVVESDPLLGLSDLEHPGMFLHILQIL
jgi:hypothetical protein